MKKTIPEVHLIARPSVDYDALRVYLDSVGGTQWLDKIAEGTTHGEPKSTEAAHVVEAAGRLCYRSWKPGLNPNVTKVRPAGDQSYFDNILSSGHGSVLEHVNWTFIFQDVSRVFTHELVRHRAGCAYSQESMRFVRLDDIPIRIPDVLLTDDDPDLEEEMRSLLNQMERMQIRLARAHGLDDGKKFAEKKSVTSAMRRFAPIGVSTSILATFNARALRHIIVMRTHPAAEEEIRTVFRTVAETMRSECPPLFSDLQEQEDGSYTTEWRKV